VKPKSAAHHRRWVLRLFEWGVITCIIAVLCGLFLNRMGRAQAAIERQNFLTTVRSMQTAALLQSVLRPREVMPGDNPATVYYDQFGLLPAGYAGELDGPDPAAVSVGSWYFDKREQQLVYRVSNTGYFRSTLSGVPRLRLQLLREDDSDRLTVSILDDGHWTVGGEDPVK
jgi:hypothetical protein